MNRKTVCILAIAGFLIFLGGGFIFAQQEKVSAEPPSALTEVQWLWGEVSSVDTANNTLVVRYIDYDTDMDKQATVVIDGKTTFDNVRSLGEIKPQDTVSIDYAVNPEGKNIAKNISLEKLEEDTIDAEQDSSLTIPEKVGSGPPSEISEPSASAKEETQAVNSAEKTEPAAAAEGQAGQ